MSEVIVITSGKGGVGKTTTTANVGTGLAKMDQKVVLIDTDIGLRNLDVVMGLENRIVYNLVDVVEGNCRIKQALIKDKRSMDDVVEILAIALIGAIPDDEVIVISTNQGEPCVGDDSMAGQAYMNICHRVMGEEVPFLDLKIKSSFLGKLKKLFK